MVVLLVDGCHGCGIAFGEAKGRRPEVTSMGLPAGSTPSAASAVALDVTARPVGSLHARSDASPATTTRTTLRIRPDATGSPIRNDSSVAVEVAGERSEALPQFGNDGTECVEFRSESFVANLEFAVPVEQAGAGFDQPGDLVRGESVADREGTAEPFDLVLGQFHPSQCIELVFGQSREWKSSGRLRMTTNVAGALRDRLTGSSVKACLPVGFEGVDFGVVCVSDVQVFDE